MMYANVFGLVKAGLKIDSNGIPYFDNNWPTKT